MSKFYPAVIGLVIGTVTGMMSPSFFEGLGIVVAMSIIAAIILAFIQGKLPKKS